jgi:hypothetical protein
MAGFLPPDLTTFSFQSLYEMFLLGASVTLLDVTLTPVLEGQVAKEN